MTSDDITEDDGNYKMNPPLRTKEDVEALQKGLADDIMDVIATDHAPHAASEKEQGIQKAPFGIVGLEDCGSTDLYSAGKTGYSDSDADGREDELQSGEDPWSG